MSKPNLNFSFLVLVGDLVLVVRFCSVLADDQQLYDELSAVVYAWFWQQVSIGHHSFL